MLSEKNFKWVITLILIISLFFLAVIIIRPIFFSILFGVFFGYLFYPVYVFFLKKLKNENLSAFLVCLILLLILLIPLFLAIYALIGQIINLYFIFQNLDLTDIVRKLLPNFLSNSQISLSIASSINTFISNGITDYLTKFTNFVKDLPINLLKYFVTLFVFFFTLRDGAKLKDYLKSLSPLDEEIETKFFKHFKDVTFSVLVGQVIIGLLQGLIAGIGYFIFNVPNVLLLTLLTAIIGIIPLIGPWLVWVPVDIYLFASGHTATGIGLLIYGLLLINWIDTIIRPLIVARRTKMNSAVVIIGMIGGLFVFGILGLIIGPLILAYVLLIVEIYRKRKFEKTIIFED